VAGRTTLEVDLDEDQLLAQVEHLERGGLFVPPIADAPPALSPVSVRLRTPAGDIEIEGCVVQVIPGAGVGLTVDDAEVARRRIAPLLARVRGEAPAASGAGNLQRRIGRMTMDEKRELARYGDRMARMALIKDTNKAIHVDVLRNKKLTSDEVRIMASYRNINPDALVKISENREWTRDSRIVAALVSNPKTPNKVALRLLDRLRANDLKRLMQSGDVPRAVSMAARRKLSERR
jgi:hypothetical protein